MRSLERSLFAYAFVFFLAFIFCMPGFVLAQAHDLQHTPIILNPNLTSDTGETFFNKEDVPQLVGSLGPFFISRDSSQTIDLTTYFKQGQMGDKLLYTVWGLNGIEVTFKSDSMTITLNEFFEDLETFIIYVSDGNFGIRSNEIYVFEDTKEGRKLAEAYIGESYAQGQNGSLGELGEGNDENFGGGSVSVENRGQSSLLRSSLAITLFSLVVLVAVISAVIFFIKRRKDSGLSEYSLISSEQLRKFSKGGGGNSASALVSDYLRTLRK